MEAPTPVSSLMHSSTLVVLGLVMLIRLVMYDLSSSWLVIIWLLGLVNYSVLSILVCQLDLKRIIAYSTLSQLGMCLVVLMSWFSTYAVYYIHVHAVFKSELFMMAGIILHKCVDNHDFRTCSSYNESLYTGFLCISVSIVLSYGIIWLYGLKRYVIWPHWDKIYLLIWMYYSYIVDMCGYNYSIHEPTFYENLSLWWMVCLRYKAPL